MYMKDPITGKVFGLSIHHLIVADDYCTKRGAETRSAFEQRYETTKVEVRMAAVEMAKELGHQAYEDAFEKLAKANRWTNEVIAQVFPGEVTNNLLEGLITIEQCVKMLLTEYYRERVREKS